MRSLLLAALGLVLIAAPVWAQQSGAAPLIFANYTCSQPVPCDDDSNIQSSQWSDAGNACIMHGFGYSAPDGFFDDIAGIDGAGCLTAKPDALTKATGMRITPHCCVVKSSANSCSFHCDMLQN